MPDWKELVRQRMSSAGSSCDLKEEIIAELAAHLEETYAAALSQGMTAEAATEFALQEVPDWHVLAAEYSSSQVRGGIVNDSNKKSVAASEWLVSRARVCCSMILQTHKRTSRVWCWFGHMAMLFYWPWLAGLPAIRSVGSVPVEARPWFEVNRGWSQDSPALVLLATFRVILPVGVAVDGLFALPLSPTSYSR